MTLRIASFRDGLQAVKSLKVFEVISRCKCR
jgi:hypothetical protein